MHLPSPIGSAAIVVLVLLAGPPTADGEPAGEAPAAIVPPEPLGVVEPAYPPEAEAAGATGEVVLRLTIDEQGRVAEALVEQPAAGPFGPAFDAAALAAARRLVFRPARRGDRPVAVQILYRYAFTLADERVEAPVDPERAAGALTGELLERETRAPVPGVRVRLPALGRETLTDADGRFAFEGVPAGPVRIRVEDPAYAGLEDEETVVAGRATFVRYLLEPVAGGDEIVVVGRRPAKEVTRRTLTVEEIRTIPGTQGDTLKVIQNLPGVARVPFGGGALVIRGSDPEDSSAYLDGHFVPQLFHFGGLRSTFGGALLEAIDFQPGNFSARYGLVGGGVVEARVRRPRGDGFHGFVEADVFDAGLLVEGPVSENATFAVAARRSYVDGILPLALPEQAAQFTVVPRYYDYQAVYDWRRGAHGLRAMLYGADDALGLLLGDPSADPAVRGRLDASVGFDRLHLAWTWRPDADLEHALSFTLGRSRVRERLGDALFLDIETDILTLRDEVSVRLGDGLRLRGGFDGMAYVADAVVRAPRPAEEGQPPTPLGAQETLSLDDTVVVAAPAAWAEVDVALGDLRVIPGARVDAFTPLETFAVDPRLTVRYTPRPGTVLKGGVGRYTSAPEADEFNETFGNPDLGLQHTLQVGAGVEQALTDGLTVDVQGFYRHSDDHVVPSADPAVKYTNDGEARAYGAEVLLRHAPTGRFFGWIAYTLMRSERRASEDAPWRLADWDQTHVLTLVGRYRLGDRWDVGLRWRYVSGRPYTPFEGAVFDSDADVYIPRPGRTNGRRLPAFHQLDLRVDRHWAFDAWTLTAYLELQNAYNRENPEALQNNYDYTETKTIDGLPLLPSLGIRGAF